VGAGLWGQGCGSRAVGCGRHLGEQLMAAGCWQACAANVRLPAPHCCIMGGSVILHGDRYYPPCLF
jgi:hypothetical protein